MLSRLLALWLLVGVFAAPCSAAKWAREMFETTSHNFGTVAAGAKAEFAFEFRNSYLWDVHVASVRSSCGCSDVRVTKKTLETYETGAVVASINSRRLRGNQSSTLTVVFDKPRYAEVQLKVSVNIRGDITLDPSEISFGEVAEGTESARELTVTHFGDADWKLIDAQSANSHLSCEFDEPTQSGSRVSYRIRITLDSDAPPGDLRDQLLLVTNNPRAQKIPVMVAARVSPPVSVSPAILYLGSIRPGESVTKRIVVRASSPFHIKEISTDCECFEFQYAPDDAKKLHLVPVKLIAGDEPRAVKRTIRIKTDLSGTEMEILAMAAVDEQAR